MNVAIVGDGSWGNSLARKLGIKVKKKPDSVSKNPAVEALVLDVPVGNRVALTAQAAQAGKHILIRGGLGNSAVKAQTVLNAINQTGTKIAVVYDRYYDPAFQSVAEQLRSGKIGKTGFFKIHCSNPSIKSKDDAGLLWGDLVHDLDWIHSELGPVKSVFAQGVEGSGHRPLEYIMITLTLRSGTIGQLIGCRRPIESPRTRLEICGTAGMIQLDTGEHPIELHNGNLNSVSPVSHDSVEQQWEAFEALLASRSTGIKAAKQSLCALRIAEAVEKSIKTNKPILVEKG